MNYDLEERVTRFGKDILSIRKSAKIDRLNTPIFDQLFRAATSVGANYFEANGASSKKDFRNKIHICKKEIKETTYWIAIAEDYIEDKESVSVIKKEAHELLLIFSKIASSSKN